MSNSDLLQIEPHELQFPFELKKQIACSMQLSNKTDNFVAFKVKTTNPKKYCVRPNTGVVVPHSTCDVIVTMQAQKEAPPDMQCRDKFLLQSVVVSPGSSAKDITAEMFSKDSGNQVDECKLRVTYVSPPQPPSPVREGSEEGSSPRASVSDNGTVNQASEFNNMSKGMFEQQDSSVEVKALISRLTEEKRSAIQQNNKLQQELELPQRIKKVMEKWGPNSSEASETEFKEQMAKIRKDIVNFHGEMVLLMNYSNINYTGLAKILKKFDKRTGGVLRLPFIQKVLQQPFFTTDLISKLVKECETTIESVFPPSERFQPTQRDEEAAAAVPGEGVFRNTVAALMTMQEMRKESSTYSHFSLPPLNMPDLDVIQSLQVVAPIQIP